MRNHLNHATNHHLAGIEVGYDAVFEGANCTNHVAAFTNHLLRFPAHGNHFVVCYRNSHHRGFVHHHLSFTSNDGIRRSEVNGNLLR